MVKSCISEPVKKQNKTLSVIIGHSSLNKKSNLRRTGLKKFNVRKHKDLIEWKHNYSLSSNSKQSVSPSKCCITKPLSHRKMFISKKNSINLTNKLEFRKICSFNSEKIVLNIEKTKASIEKHATELVGMLNRNTNILCTGVASSIPLKMEKEQILVGNYELQQNNEKLNSIISQRIPSELDAKYDSCISDSFFVSFGSVRKTLQNIFLLDFDQMEIQCLSYAEITILDTIIDKKFGVKLPIKNIYTSTDFKKLMDIKPTKRPEESYKFVFKHAFKWLKEYFCIKQDISLEDMKKTSTMDKFYKYYFKEISDKYKIGIESFYLPLTPDAYGVDTKKVIAKTINSTYIRLIIKSKAFLKDFKYFIKHKLKKEYSAIIPRKIDNIIIKFEREFKAACYSDRYVDILAENLRNNKKCKLPWTVNELDYSTSQTIKLIRKNLL